MCGRIIFLLEEPSMREFLLSWLARHFPSWAQGSHFDFVVYKGKSDLDKNFTKKLRSWHFPNDRFIILRDNDSADCIQQKEKLRNACIQCGRPNTLVRLVCQELEGWYLGDLKALSVVSGNPKLNSSRLKKQFTNPDIRQKPSRDIERLWPDFQKRQAARLMGQYLDHETNQSHSLKVFVEGVRQVARSMGYSEGGA